MYLHLKLVIVFCLFVLCITGCAQKYEPDYFLYVGTYTDAGSEGIYVYTFNTHSGMIDSVGAEKGVQNPSYLALSPDKSTLYAVNEMADSLEATVSSFARNSSDGSLQFINKQPSRGGAPCYVGTDKNGEVVFTANYLGGSFTMFPVNDDGSLAGPVATVEHQGGSINKERQRSSHVHCTYVAPDNRYVIVNDLGTDKVFSYAFDAQKNDLPKEPHAVYEVKAGSGPRHITFHPNGRFAYLINELNGSIVAFSYDEGTLTELQTVSTLPDNYKGAISGADIHVSPDGKFLYASNRQDLNDIVIYGIDSDTGNLKFAGRHDSGGEHPRNFMIDPTGQYLLVANRDTDNVVVFKRNKETGLLRSTGQKITLSKPVYLKMVEALF